jgi:hypothetical protein
MHEFDEEIKTLEEIRERYTWNVTADTALLRAIKAFRVLNNLTDDINAIRGACGLENDAYDKAVAIIEEKKEEIKA